MLFNQKKIKYLLFHTAELYFQARLENENSDLAAFQVAPPTLYGNVTGPSEKVIASSNTSMSASDLIMSIPNSQINNWGVSKENIVVPKNPEVIVPEEEFER